jgi:hypothetical protein
MDRKSSEKAEIERLIRLSQSARACLQSESARIKQRFDIPERIRGSLGAHPFSWLCGSLASGLVASQFLRRRKPAPPVKNRSSLGWLLGLTLTALQPLARVWLSRQMECMLQKISATPPNSQPIPKSRFP